MQTAAVKRVLLGFWMLWLGVIAATNLFSLLKALRLVSPTFAFASHNFDLVQSFLATYHAAPTFVIFLFSGLVAWQWLTVLLFCCALSAPNTENAAFGAAMALFAAFLIAGELLLRYDFEAIHMRILIALVASWTAVRLVPNGD